MATGSAAGDLIGPVHALCLAGPTASGKTAAALALARELPLEVISVDSAQVYRGLDIGTAKPDARERSAVAHHLIDILDPSESFSAARFATDARRLIDEINRRGRLALLVGGTMLYFKALREGLDPLPQADPAIRSAIEQQAAEHGWPALHRELARIDPATAARVQPADAQRIQRALEVWQVSGLALSTWHSSGKDRRQVLQLPLVAMEPLDRGWLHARIAQRFEAMLQAGFVDEVRRLRARGDLLPQMPSMRCVGYRQAWNALDSGDLAGLAPTAIAATRQLAKRQLTWLRSVPDRIVVACDAVDSGDRVLAALLGAVRGGA